MPDTINGRQIQVFPSFCPARRARAHLAKPLIEAFRYGRRRGEKYDKSDKMRELFLNCVLMKSTETMPEGKIAAAT